MPQSSHGCDRRGPRPPDGTGPREVRPTRRRGNTAHPTVPRDRAEPPRAARRRRARHRGRHRRGRRRRAGCRGTAPTSSWAVLEARDAIGGTWDLFRYPGIRSDSDMYTLGFPFRPWRGAVLDRDGGGDPRLRAATAHEHGVTERTTSASGSSGSSGARPTAAGRSPAAPGDGAGAAHRPLRLPRDRLLLLRVGARRRLPRPGRLRRRGRAPAGTGPRGCRSRAAASSSSAAAPPPSPCCRPSSTRAPRT